MPLDYDKIRNRRFADVVHTYTERDTILYALGLGYGHDPLDTDQLRFVYEDRLRCAPTMPVILGYPGFWMKEPDAGIDWVRVVHGEQSLVLHAAIPVAGTVVGRTKVKAVVDKGRDKGALVIQERTVTDQATGRLLATLEQVTFCRGDGGFGGGDDPPPPAPPMPTTPPELVRDLPTIGQAALLYRLSADPNPLHADPSVARAAGFQAPILHGLCTFGAAGHALLGALCGYEPGRLSALSARFSAPVYPGETLRTEIWQQGDDVRFRTRARERDVVVLDHGRARLS